MSTPVWLFSALLFLAGCNVAGPTNCGPEIYPYLCPTPTTTITPTEPTEGRHE